MVRSWLKKLKKKRSLKSSDFSATSGEESALEDENSADQSPYFTSKRSHKTETKDEHAQSPYGNVINLKDHFKKFCSDVENDFSEDDRQYGYDSTDDCSSSRSDTLPSASKQGNNTHQSELENLINESGRLLRESKDMNGDSTSIENIELFDDSMLLAFQGGHLSFQDFLVSPKHGIPLNNNTKTNPEEEDLTPNSTPTPTPVLAQSEDCEDDQEETERFDSGDDSSLDEYSGVKAKPNDNPNAEMSPSNNVTAINSVSTNQVSNPKSANDVLPSGSERTNCAGTPYPEVMIPKPETSSDDLFATPYEDFTTEKVLTENEHSLDPKSSLLPGASLEKLAQEIFSDDTLHFSLKSNLFEEGSDFHLSVSQQDINSRDCKTPTAEDFCRHEETDTNDTVSMKTTPQSNRNSDSEMSDESEHTIVNTASSEKNNCAKRQQTTDRKALKSMPNFPPMSGILGGATVDDKNKDFVDMRSRSADAAARHTCDSPSVAQREVCIVEDKIISAPGSYTRLLSNDEDEPPETNDNIKRKKSRATTDPWLAYLPTWKQCPDPDSQKPNGRSSRGYASQTSSVITESNATDSDASTISGRISISSEYSTTSGAETSLGDDRSLKGGLEIDFYLPPPPPIDEYYVESDREFLLDASPFNLDWDYEQSDSPTLTPSSSVIFLGRQHGRSSGLSSGADDPISESLLAMLPIPEDNYQPVVSQAVGEIITEIISSRQKFAKLSRQLDTHEKLLKEHGQQIQKQNRELDELRRSKENRACERVVRTGGHERIKKRAASVNKLVNKSNTRRSRDISGLSSTLDRLLFQCYTLQKNSKAEKETHLYQPLTGVGRRNGRRRTPCEDRIRTKKVKALLVRRAPVVPVYYSQIIPPAKAILKTFNLVSEGIRKPDWI